MSLPCRAFRYALDRHLRLADDRDRSVDLDSGPQLPLLIGYGLFIGLFGLGGINAPLYVYVSRWFDRRRGSALALISSGSYFAGAMWPPVFEHAIAVRLAADHALVRRRRDRRRRPLAAIYLRTRPN